MRELIEETGDELAAILEEGIAESGACSPSLGGRSVFVKRNAPAWGTLRLSQALVQVRLDPP